MGLFDFFKSKKDKQNKNDSKQEKKESFTKLVLKTDNVSETLEDVGRRYGISVANLDFDILKIETYIKKRASDSFTEMTEEIEQEIIEKNLLLKESFTIKQEYEIKVKKFNFSNNFQLMGKVDIDKKLTSAVFLVSPNSKLKYSDKLEKMIINELYKRKLRHQMIIKFKPFEEKMYKDVKKLVKQIRVVGEIEEIFPITLCEAIAPIMPVKLQIIEHYKEKLEKNKSYVKDLVFPIKKGEVIIEIIKPKSGKNGRNCKGEFLKVPVLKEEKFKEYKVDEKEVKRSEDENSIKYIANKDGYVTFKWNTIIIEDEVEVSQISLQTGSVRNADDKQVKVEVKQKDALKEAVGDGISVETMELKVGGNVGCRSKIKAKKLTVEGQTHRKSEIIAVNADINIHRGILRGKKVKIKRLEGGKVKAEKVEIEKAIGGEVIAKEIEIDSVESHVVFIASDLIEVKKINGEENKFIIDESRVDDREKKIEEIKHKIRALSILHRKVDERYKHNKNLILRNRRPAEELKKRIIKYKKNGMEIKQNWIDKIKQFNELINKDVELKEQLAHIKEEIKALRETLNEMQYNIFAAKVISHSGFPEFNRIEFHLTNPSKEFIYDTKESDRDTKKFTLKCFGNVDEDYNDDEVECEIIGSKEIDE